MKKNKMIAFIIIMLISLNGCTKGKGMHVTVYNLKIIDNNDIIYDKPDDSFFQSGSVLKFHANVIYDADLGMYINGELYSMQTAVETENGYIWEYTFTMIPEDVEIEFKIINGKSD